MNSTRSWVSGRRRVARWLGDDARLVQMEALEPRLQLSGASDLVHTTSELSSARQDSTAASLSGRALIAGGELSNFALTAQVESFDPMTGQTSEFGTLSAGRVLLSALRVGRKVLFAGGYPAGAVSGRREPFVIDVYDAATDTWSHKTFRRLRLMTAAVAVGDKAIFVGSTNNLPATRHADVFNATTGRWRRVRLPIAGLAGGGTAIGDLALFGAFHGVNVFNGRTGRWSKIPQTAVGGIVTGPAIAIGAKAIFNGGTVYDAVSGVWSNLEVPPSTGNSTLGAATVLGTKVLYAGDGTDVVRVYDLASGQWSMTTLSAARYSVAATTVGTHAVFAGGAVRPSFYEFDPVDTVDVYTDAAPAPVLAGDLSGRGDRGATVGIFNTGDADLPAGASVEVYASTERRIDGSSVLIGRAVLSDALAAGASVRVGVATSLKGLAAGRYHLVAGVDAAGGVGVTAIAAQARTFGVSGSAAGAVGAGAGRSTRGARGDGVT